MSPLGQFLLAAKKRVERHLAVVWALRGAVVVAIGMLAVQLLLRRWPTDPQWPPLAATSAVGVLVAVAGWVRARPSLLAVAQLADANLGGLERLSTALQFVDHGHPLATRQRADAEAWVGTADPQRVVRDRLPRREMAIAVAAGAVAIGLAFVPNSSLQRLRTERAGEAARDIAAEDVAALAGQVAEEARSGEDPGRREALLRVLRTVEEALREVETGHAAVAALSRAQGTLRTLADPASDAGRDAADAAGITLARGASGAQASAAGGAGRSSSPSDPAAAELLQRLSDALPALRPHDAAAPSPADAPGGGSAGATGDQAAGLAALLAGSTAAQLDQVAQALDQAAAAAAGDRQLAAELARAAESLRADRPADAAAALAAANRRGERSKAGSNLNADVSQASNGLEAVKARLLADMAARGASSGTSRSPRSGAEVMACGDMAGHAHDGPGHVHAVPSTRRGDAPTTTRAGDAGCRSSGAAGDSGDAGPAPDAGEERGAGQGQGSGQGSESGSGSGPGAGSGSGSGSGASRDARGRSGAVGTLGEGPAPPGEKVFVPGRSGPGRTQALPGDGISAGADTALLPYESVYPEYRAAALSQAERQLMPERLRELLRQYFQEGP